MKNAYNDMFDLKKQQKKLENQISNFSELEYEKYKLANANPFRSDPGRIEKINLIFSFHTSFFKGLHKTFWGTTEKCEIKNFKLIFVLE